MGQARTIATRTSRPHLIPASTLSSTAAALAATTRLPIVCLMDAFPVSLAVEVVGTDHDDDHLTALHAVGRGDRQRNPGDRR
jgi:hypothetical protein